MSDEEFVPPKAPSDLCFNEMEFVQKVFDVDKFLQEHRKNVSLEKMRDDLGIYSKILRSAMIELINKDYADFVSLSSNLIGLDKSIDDLKMPLCQLEDKLLEVTQCLDDTIEEVTSNLDKHKNIRDKRQSIHSLIRFNKSVTKLSNILSSCDESSVSLKPDVLERAATEYNQLKFHSNRCKSELSQEKIDIMTELDKHLKNNLNALLVAYVNKKETENLIRCLRIYVSLDKMMDAEEVVRKKIVVPAVESIISEHSFQNDPLELKGTYQKLENVLDSTLKELLEVTSENERTSVQGFNFLVNSFWTEIEQRLEDYLPVIFAPGNPELFHKRYTETLSFLQSLNDRCSPETKQVLRSHPQYGKFFKKWNLPVYYQIRFQEIGGTAESVLSATVSFNSIRVSKAFMSPDSFTLHATCIVWDCLLRVWADDVYIPQLLDSFWKLCLQLCSRYQIWCQSSLKQAWHVVTVNETAHSPEAENAQRLEFLVGLHTDIEKLSTKISNFTVKEIPDKLANFDNTVIDLMNGCLIDTIRLFDESLPEVTKEIISELLSPGLIHLRQISDIPRLFRRTNRDVPTKPCPYVKRSLDFLSAFYDDYKNVVPSKVNDWLILALKSLTQQYLSSVKDVLISVQKTEESLRRLKKIRDKSSGVSSSESQVTSDDEKIRIQLLIDVKSYIEMIKEWGINQNDIENLNELLEVVESAIKNKSEIK